MPSPFAWSVYGIFLGKRRAHAPEGLHDSSCVSSVYSGADVKATIMKFSDDLMIHVIRGKSKTNLFVYVDENWSKTIVRNDAFDRIVNGMISFCKDSEIV